MILWEYEEILHQGLLKEAISEALPHFASISSLSLPYLADDRYVFFPLEKTRRKAHGGRGHLADILGLAIRIRDPSTFWPILVSEFESGIRFLIADSDS